MSVAQLDSVSVLSGEVAVGEVLLVADRFRGIAEDDRAFTVSGLVAALRGGRWRESERALTVHLGQGVTRHDLDYLEHVALVHAPAGLHVRGAVDEPAPRHQVHKYQNSNVLLANLIRESETEFRADLRIHGDNELLLDHQTGEHVQGIVIVEAVRQLFLGAFELEYGRRWPEQHFYIVWNSIELEFKTFLFPLPATLHAVLTPIAIEDPAKLEFAIDVDVRQLDRTVATTRITYAALPNERISQIERHKAAKAIAAYLGAVA
ncbi:AfsA-related hotdog domain-containing protein [Nocardia sp. CDC160]|uniref:AfsA-related hotdog domain-containing protein n=1 Tax=Nocardia sp. CDC160 TaxID=3112166 RepID=UPI002DB585D5|nr:AfsA-related hotdog domain-containing protein [Nocardia sp. CDC160]MEC3914650.1 AfsA-related hotdog domain-containing protein [Nocardia sp. CDC160]